MYHIKNLINEMKTTLTISIVILFFLNSIPLFSQDSTSVNIQNIKDDISQLKQDASKQNELKESLLIKAEHDIEIASKIIDWSAMIFTVLTVILVIAGAIGLKEFSNIRKIESEMKTLNNEMKNEIENIKNIKNLVQKEIDDIKKNNAKESKDFLKIVYLLNEGISYYQSGDLAHAIESFLKVKEINPHDYEATCYLARSYIGQEKYEYALKIAKSALDLNPKPSRAHMIIGEAYRRLKEYDKAINSIKKSIELERRSSTLNNLGYSYIRKQDFENALNTFRESLEIRRNNPAACCGLAQSYLKKGLPKEAKEYFREAILLAKEDIMKGTTYVWPYYNLAFSHMALNNIDDCHSTLNIALEMNKNPAIIKEQLIGYESMKGEKEISQDLLKSCLDIIRNALYSIEKVA